MAQQDRLSINDIQDQVRNTGSHWFDPDTMRGFGCRIGAAVYQGPGGIYFVSSEKPPHGERAYTVRQFMRPGGIGTVGTFCGLSRHEANKLARQYSETPLQDQFAAALAALDCEMTGQTSADYGTIAAAIAGELFALSDGTQCKAERFESRGFYLVQNNVSLRWSDQYQLRSEVCRVLETHDSNSFDQQVIETAQEFRPVSILEQFLADCRQHGSDSATETACKGLIFAAKTHHKMMEDNCSIPGAQVYDDDGEAGTELQRLITKITSLANSVGAVGVVISGDPRGATVKLRWVDGTTNDYAKEGWVVPRRETDDDLDD